MFEFEIDHKSTKSKARTGIFKTPHGKVNTPVFMPVGTVGAVKTMMPSELKSLGSEIILGNTYHLYLRPGEQLIKKLGGLQKFTGWNKPMLTDSGGYQVFSLGSEKRNSKLATPSLASQAYKNSNLKSNSNFQNLKTTKPAKISEQGVTFYSHLDGSKHFISPEKSIQIQENLGADIIMAFDQVPSAFGAATADKPAEPASYEEVKDATERTHRWLERCIKTKKRKDQALFPICQGGQFKDLREMSAKKVSQLDMPGYAIGGVSVGEKKEKIYEVTALCSQILPDNKPRYLMGIGYPEDICRVVKLGIDMFDCVLPTRLARHGVVWIKRTKRQKNKIKKLEGLDYDYDQIDLSKTKNLSASPIDGDCPCPACQGFSRFYINHLLKEGEALGIHLTTVHNLHFTHQLVNDIRQAIKDNKF